MRESDKSPHEGAKLKAVVTVKHGKRAIDLAVAAGTNKQGVDRWFNAKKIGPKMWKAIRPGLLKLDIDPKDIKVDDPLSEPEEDLRPLFKALFSSKEQLEALKKALEASASMREKLIYFVDAALTYVEK